MIDVWSCHGREPVRGITEILSDVMPTMVSLMTIAGILGIFSKIKFGKEQPYYIGKIYFKRWDRLEDDEPEDDDIKEFEFDGHSFKIDYGIELVNEDRRYLDYEDYVELLNPDYEWIFDRTMDYQGEWFAVGIDEFGQYYFHQGSYGSCSGCDWLQGIYSIEGAIEFLKEMKKIIPIGKYHEAVRYLGHTKNNVWKDAKKVISNLIHQMPIGEQHD